MISNVDLIDFWEITRALYGDGESSEAEQALIRPLLDAALTKTATVRAPGDGAAAAPKPAMAA
jgi:hypothetical protein